MKFWERYLWIQCDFFTIDGGYWPKIGWPMYWFTNCCLKFFRTGRVLLPVGFGVLCQHVYVNNWMTIQSLIGNTDGVCISLSIWLAKNDVVFSWIYNSEVHHVYHVLSVPKLLKGYPVKAAVFSFYLFFPEGRGHIVLTCSTCAQNSIKAVNTPEMNVEFQIHLCLNAIHNSLKDYE